MLVFNVDAFVAAATFCVDCSTPPNSSTPVLSIWQSHLETQADVYKPHAQARDATLLSRMLHWTVTCSNYFRHPAVCTFCGIFKLGSSANTDSSGVRKVPLFGTTPPYAIGNAFLAQFTMSSDGQWNCCKSCLRSVHVPIVLEVPFELLSLPAVVLICVGLPS